MPVAEKTEATVQIPKAAYEAILAKLDELSARDAARQVEAPVEIGPRTFAKAPWAEEIWVEPLVDCLHPDHPEVLRSKGILEDPSNYGVYRYCATDERPADVFRLKHRELLNRHMRELSKEEVDDVRKRFAAAKSNTPQQAARNYKAVRNPFH